LHPKSLLTGGRLELAGGYLLAEAMQAQAPEEQLAFVDYAISHPE
jgi:hypothetical protein